MMKSCPIIRPRICFGNPQIQKNPGSKWKRPFGPLPVYTSEKISLLRGGEGAEGMPSFHVTRVKSIDLDLGVQVTTAENLSRHRGSHWTRTGIHKINHAKCVFIPQPNLECVHSAIGISSMQWISIMNPHLNVLLQEVDTTVNICACSPAKDWDFWAVCRNFPFEEDDPVPSFMLLGVTQYTYENMLANMLKKYQCVKLANSKQLLNWILGAFQVCCDCAWSVLLKWNQIKGNLDRS